MWRSVSVSLLALLVWWAQPSDRGEAASKRLTLYGGVTLYPNPSYDSLSLAEFSFSMNRHELDFYQPEGDSLYYARVFAQINVYGPRGAVVDSASTYFSVRVPDLQEAAKEGIRLFNKLSLYLAPGIYSARLTVIDAVSKRRAEVFHPSVEVVPPEKKRVSLSEVCVAYKVSMVGDDPVGVDGRLVKNGFYVVPNPIATFNLDNARVHLYAEAYNLSYRADSAATVEISLAVLNADSLPYKDFGRRVLESSGKSAVVTESFAIYGWPTGVYFGRLVVHDLESGGADTAYAPFQVVSDEVLAAATKDGKAADPYDRLTLDQKEQLVTYLFTPDEKDVLFRLGDRARLNYLDQYWREHDEYPETPEIENRLDLIERYKDANRLFSLNTERTDGWNTDLGRVLMKYGRPTRIEDKTAEWLTGNTIQIWYYWDWEEGKYFVFEEKWRVHYDFVLVHSNVDGEVYDKEWQAALDAGDIDLNFSPGQAPGNQR